MAVNLPPLGELAAVPGVRLGVACAGIKQSVRDDLALIELSEGAAVAGLFTRNSFRAPPVDLAERRIQLGRPRLLLINSGNANAATGAPGAQDAAALCRHAAECCGLDQAEVLPFSTGVIGERLPVAAMRTAIGQAAQALTPQGWAQAAHSILTTDTGPKAVSEQIQVAGASVTITGIAKGAGMIKPNMATMLAFVCCDAKVDRPTLHQLSKTAGAGSFNRITVDGDTSTNDAFVVCATGLADHGKITSPASTGFPALQRGLARVADQLAERIVRDAEGATKFVRVQVIGGVDDEECLKVAYALAESPLVKTALFAGDPNWGRFCMAIGRADVAGLDPAKVSLDLNAVPVARCGLVAEDYDEAAAAAVMAQPEFSIRVGLGRGASEQIVLTSDLSYDYVRINAEYRT